MLNLIVKEVKQGFVWGYSGSKILGGCKKGVTYTTPGERMGYRTGITLLQKGVCL